MPKVGAAPGDDRLRLPPGTRLDDAYVIEDEIGAGGFGITYIAQDTALGAKVAIKEYFPAEIGDRDTTMGVQPLTVGKQRIFEWGRSGFLTEARMLAGFSHPSIVRVRRFFEANNTAYMVLDFEEGRSFAKWLDGLGRAPTQDELDRITAGLIDALSAIHAGKLVHRDIAPDNIIIRPDGSPVLLDFGAARYELAERSRVGDQPQHTGTFAVIKRGYSPIEQHSTDMRNRGAWSDIYALGATLYRAVSGKPPTDAHERMVAESDPLRPAAAVARGNYRRRFLAGIDAALRLKRNERPQTVAELVRLLLGEEETVADRRGREGARPGPAPTADAEPTPRATTEIPVVTFDQLKNAAPPATPVPGIGRFVPLLALVAVALVGLGLWIGMQRPPPAPGPETLAAWTEIQGRTQRTIAQVRQKLRDASGALASDASRTLSLLAQFERDLGTMRADVERMRALSGSEEQRRSAQALADEMDGLSREADALRRLADATGQEDTARRRAFAETQNRAQRAIDQARQTLRDAEAAFATDAGRTRSLLTQMERDQGTTLRADIERLRSLSRSDEERRAAQQLADELAGLSRQAEALRQRPAPPRPSAPPPAPQTVRTFEGFDADGGDVGAARKDVDLGECETACRGESRCVAYVYDKWNRFCFIKSRVGELLRNARATLVVRDATVDVRRSAKTIDFERWSNHEFPGQLIEERTADSTDQCETHCEGVERCVAFTYWKATKRCRLFWRTEVYRPNSAADSRAKRQRP